MLHRFPLLNSRVVIIALTMCVVLGAVEAIDVATSDHVAVANASERAAVTGDSPLPLPTDPWTSDSAGTDIDPAVASLQGRPVTASRNADGRSCHWYGYCDFRLSNSSTAQIIDMLNAGAAAASICAAIAARTGGWGAVGAVGCGIAIGILWGAAVYLQWLIDTWHRGVYIRIFYWGAGSYVWHQ